MDNVFCRGTESSLFECSHNGFDRHNCIHGEDAGVRCSSKSNVDVLSFMHTIACICGRGVSCIIVHINLQIRIVMRPTIKSDWLVETIVQRVVWRSPLRGIILGVRSVMTVGTSVMLRLSADSLALMELWRLSQMPALELVMRACLFFLMMSSALVMSLHWQSASRLLWVSIIADILRMLESDVIVSCTC